MSHTDSCPSDYNVDYSVRCMEGHHSGHTVGCYMSNIEGLTFLVSCTV